MSPDSIYSVRTLRSDVGLSRPAGRCTCAEADLTRDLDKNDAARDDKVVDKLRFKAMSATLLERSGDQAC